MTLLAVIGATMLVTAGGLQACSPPQTPPDFGTVPRLAVAARAATATRKVAGVVPAPRPAGATGSRRRPTRQPARPVPPGAVVPAGKVAPVQVTLPGKPPAPVVPEGATGGRLGIPEAVNTLGWWVDGADSRAATGSMVIAGHVDAVDQGIGYLAGLRDIGPGAQVTVRGADGAVRAYYVTGRRTYRKSDGLPGEVFSQSVQNRLVLITCTGRFDPATGRYEDNLVVYAVPGD